MGLVLLSVLSALTACTIYAVIGTKLDKSSETPQGNE